MAHYMIPMNGSDPDPVHTGDMKSWFFYYKWRLGEEDEVCYPLYNDALPELGEGDLVWFAMDGELVGRVTILRVMDDPFNGRREAWFNTRSCRVVEPGVHVGTYVGLGPISPDLAQDFTGHLLVEGTP